MAETPTSSPASGDPDAGVSTAGKKFACATCGAEAQWNPGKQALVCPYCGAVSPAKLEVRGADTVIVEHDLVAALRGIPDSERGWNAEKLSVKCQSCQAISVFDPGQIGRKCDFCGSSALVPYAEAKEPFRPESLLPFAVSEPQARDAIHGWYKRQWLAPNGFSGKARTDSVRGIYLPYWTFDAHADAQWTAESGRYYYVEVNGKREQRTEWSYASGQLSHDFDDELVCASVGVNADRLRKVEPFPTGSLVPFDAGYLSGWTVERYQIDLVAAAQRSRQQMDSELESLCSRQVPGDTQRNLQVSAAYSGQTYKHILAPVWMLTYVYGAKPYQVVVNGVTGTISGTRPWSWVKITLLVIAALIVLLFVLSVNN